ncbi:uncharacterized protein J8A68_004551 [[Candida] subhashii]|uniref:Uncharacterized protein n=1 Tax=[Candida] subhashii TaxID=561895 RepID=A0A8J5QH21_9ASCO|nr:uncharacterized protein J8A68_004551 [[Candida] subhashii]KAG7661948.1 hypothetical protein J8A68_004551 [[Candida] subhashii]
MASFTVPDLRFEQSFMKQLNTYAGAPTKKKQHHHHHDHKLDDIAKLTDEELKQMSQQIDEEEQQELEQQPLPVITPSIVIYAIIKDQILMPLLQGFAWTGFLMLLKPFLRLVIRNGQHTGHWLANLIGINRLQRSSIGYSYYDNNSRMANPPWN